MVVKPKRIEVSELQGFKYFEMITELLKKLRDVGTERDQSGNRDFFCDQYLSLLLLYFFNPAITSFNALQQASELEKVQKLLGVKRVSIGSLSEAVSVFDPRPVEANIRELADRAVPLMKGREAEALRGLTAVDGSRRRQGDRDVAGHRPPGSARRDRGTGIPVSLDRGIVQSPSQNSSFADFGSRVTEHK